LLGWLASDAERRWLAVTWRRRLDVIPNGRSCSAYYS